MAPGTTPVGSLTFGGLGSGAGLYSTGAGSLPCRRRCRRLALRSRSSALASILEHCSMNSSVAPASRRVSRWNFRIIRSSVKHNSPSSVRRHETVKPRGVVEKIHSGLFVEARVQPGQRALGLHPGLEMLLAVGLARQPVVAAIG